MAQVAQPFVPHAAAILPTCTIEPLHVLPRLNFRSEASGDRLQFYAHDTCAINERAFKTSVRQARFSEPEGHCLSGTVSVMGFSEVNTEYLA